MAGSGSSFENFAAYRRALKEIPVRLWERAGDVSSPEAELTDVRDRAGAVLRRRLEWYDVVGMGVGGMMGAGIFVTTGSVARTDAGPAVSIAYLVAGFTALLSAVCYTEFAVEMPVAGGAFSYLRITFGEFAAYLTGANLIMEYVLSNAAVARSFMSYLVSIYATGKGDFWRIKASGLGPGFNRLDFVAFAIVIIITIFLCYSTKQSAILNLVVTAIHLLFVIFIIIVGFVKGTMSNLSEPGHQSSAGGFSPFGWTGVFNGAAVVYFSYIGYDAVSTMAEEVKYPVKAMPVGVSGSVVIVTILYTLMSISICLLQPYDEIDPEAPFSMAFTRTVGWGWATGVVGMGASLGIFTSLLVSMLGQARYLCVIGRSHVVPYWFATINPKTGTPINATAFLGGCTAIVSLLSDLDVLLNMVSIGTLFVFYMVANALIFHRHVAAGLTKPWPTISFLVLLSSCSVGFVAVWKSFPNCWWGLGLFGSLSVIITIIFCFYVPDVQESRACNLPVMVWIASLSVFLNIFLLGWVDVKAYKRFAIWSALAVVYYLLYGVHATHDKEELNKNERTLIGINEWGSETHVELELESESRDPLNEKQQLI